MKPDYVTEAREGMKKEHAKSLLEAAKQTAKNYSRPDRERNAVAQETFEVDRIVPLSESTAAVIFLKNTGKRAVAFFFYLPPPWGWRHIFASDSHILGMEAFGKHKLEVEEHNYAYNFDQGELLV